MASELEREREQELEQERELEQELELEQEQEREKMTDADLNMIARRVLQSYGLAYASIPSCCPEDSDKIVAQAAESIRPLCDAIEAGIRCEASSAKESQP